MPKSGKNKQIEDCGNFWNAQKTQKGAQVNKSLLLKIVCWSVNRKVLLLLQWKYSPVLCFGNSFEMQLAFHPSPTSYMQWSNTLSNVALWCARLWRAQPCLIPRKCFSVCLHHSVSYRLISQPMLELENTLNCSCTGSYSIGTTFLFLYSLLPTKKKKKSLVFS